MAAPRNSSSGSGQIPGVPHNLGAGSATSPSGAPGTPGAPSAPAGNGAPSGSAQPPTNTPGDPAPYRAQAPGGPAAPLDPSPQYSAAAQKPRLADRIITILLLVVGALGALNIAASIYSLKSSFEMMASAAELSDYTAPSSLTTLGTIGAIVIFAIYALNLIYSIQRLRARKLSFWVPLVAFVVAFIAAMVFSGIAMGQSPEIVEALNKIAADPDGMTTFLNNLMSQTTTAP